MEIFGKLGLKLTISFIYECENIEYSFDCDYMFDCTTTLSFITVIFLTRNVETLIVL